MTRQIQVPDDLYNSLCAIAKARGHPVHAGRGSGMVATLRELAELGAPLRCAQADEVWMRFNARIQPAINELMLEAARHSERVAVDFDAARGLALKRVFGA